MTALADTRVHGHRTSVRGRSSAGLAAALALLSMLCAAGGVLLSAVTVGWEGVYLDEPVGGVVLAIVGGILAARVAVNAIGWVFLAGGLAGGLATLSNAFLYAGLDAGYDLPAMTLAAALGGSLWMGPFLVVPVLLLLFPDGRVGAGVWRLALWAAITGGVGALVSFSTLNVIAAGAGFVEEQTPPLPVLAGLALAGTLVVAGLLSGLVRLWLVHRRVRGAARQQVRWLLLGGVTAVLTVLASVATGQELLYALALLPVPVATGVAVLRYRLFDLDRLLGRTLVYTIVSAIVAGAYIGIVTGLSMFAPGEDSSPVVVASSTLAAAALVRPVRLRAQHLVDRRFNRRRYDAARTVEAFGQRLRSQVDLDALVHDLCGVTADALEPASIALWLPAPPTRPDRQPEKSRIGSQP